MKRCGRIAVAAVLACAITALQSARAQAWPTRPVHVIVPYPAGGTNDMIARLVSAKLGASLGQPVVVENRSGANGAIGSAYVARAAPDGYVVLATAISHVTSKFLSKNLPFDPLLDFTPITAAAESVNCIAVHPSLPAGNLRELIDYALRNPGRISYGSAGVGSVFHMIGELFNRTTGTVMVHVPYKGNAPATSDLIAGQVPVIFTAVSTALPHLRSGKIRVLAVLEPVRYALLPGVPSINEAVPAFEKPASWFGFFGPPRLPRPLLSRLNGEIVRALNEPDVRVKFDEAALAVIGNSPEQFATLVRNGIEQYGRIVKAAGIQPD